MKRLMLLALLGIVSCLLAQAAAGATWRDLAGRADSLIALGSPDSANAVVEQAITLALSEYAESDTTVSLCIRRGGPCETHYFRSYAEAESLYARVLGIKERILGSNNADVASAMHTLGWIYYLQKRDTEAESLFTQVLAIREKVLGTYDRNVAQTLHNLGLLYKRQQRFAEAESVYTRSLAIRERVLEPDDLDLAWSLFNLAGLYYEVGKYQEAEPLFRRVLAIREKVLGPDDLLVGPTLNNLAGVYIEQGKYAAAEPLFRRAMAIEEKCKGTEHPDLIAHVGNLAIVCYEQAKYVEAEALFMRAIGLIEKNLGTENVELATVYNNLANLYAEQGRCAEAEPLLEQSLSMWEKALGPEHYYLAYPLHTLGVCYSDRGAYAEAELVLRRALDVIGKALGPESPVSTEPLRDLAAVYSNQGKYTEAEPLYRRALAIWQDAVGDKHPDYASGIEAFSRHYRLAGEPEAALDLAAKAFEIRRKNFRDGSAVMSERDALTYSKFMQRSADSFLSAYFDIERPGAGATHTAADVVLSTKGKTSETTFVRAAEMNMLAQLGAMADSLRDARTLLSKLYVSGATGGGAVGQREALEQATREKERLEARLASSNATYRNLQEALEADPDRIRDMLRAVPRRMALVEYARYNYQPASHGGPIPRYLVLVIDRDRPMKIVDLGEASLIDDLIDRYRRHMLDISSSGKWPTVADQHGYRDIAAALYEVIWKPIEEMTVEPSLVLVAPDGGLNMVAFASLMDDAGRYLVETTTIHYLSSGRDLIRLRDEAQPARGLLALGDPDYNAPAYARLMQEPSREEPVTEIAGLSTRNVRSGCVELQDMTVSSLPGTRHEVELIASGWAEHTDEPLTVRLGIEASEERLKTEGPGNRIIHLATHGYFLEGVCQPEEPAGPLGSNVGFLGENPLLLSGLLLAGGNLHGTGADSLGAEDGVLTAEEVTAMTLSGTQVVVLSACETGLGRVRDGEGVYGLRRAFQMAGARTVFSALWPVADEATAMMMSQLYERHGDPMPDALRRIQTERIDDLHRASRCDHPFSWGGFIALGDWR